MEYVLYAATIVLAYLLGAIPFGLLVGKLAKNVDIRQYGSGNVGAANALRTLGWKASISVFALDIAKAVAAVLVARFAVGTPTLEAACGVAAIAGHNWPIYIKFKGGRGVSSGLGVLLLFSPLLGLVGLALGLALMAWSRYVSLGSVVGAIVIPVLMLAMAGPMNIPEAYVAFAWVVGAMVVFQHRGNIQRILAGTERKIGERGEHRTASNETR